MRYEVELVDGTVLSTSERNDIDWITFGVFFHTVSETRIIPWQQVKEVRMPRERF